MNTTTNQKPKQKNSITSIMIKVGSFILFCCVLLGAFFYFINNSKWFIYDELSVETIEELGLNHKMKTVEIDIYPDSLSNEINL